MITSGLSRTIKLEPSESQTYGGLARIPPLSHFNNEVLSICQIKGVVLDAEINGVRSTPYRSVLCCEHLQPDFSVLRTQLSLRARVHWSGGRQWQKEPSLDVEQSGCIGHTRRNTREEVEQITNGGKLVSYVLPSLSPSLKRHPPSSAQRTSSGWLPPRLPG